MVKTTTTTTTTTRSIQHNNTTSVFLFLFISTTTTSFFSSTHCNNNPCHVWAFHTAFTNIVKQTRTTTDYYPSPKWKNAFQGQEKYDMMMIKKKKHQPRVVMLHNFYDRNEPTHCFENTIDNDNHDTNKHDCNNDIPSSSSSSSSSSSIRDANNNHNNRRAFLLNNAKSHLLLLLTTTTVTTTTTTTPANAASGAKGAAEYDMEYYLRDLLKGNKREGNLPASAPPPIPPPRTISDPFLSLLLTTDFSNDNDDKASCVPYRELLSITKKNSKKKETAADIQNSITSVRSKSKQAFASSQRIWNVENVSDQYYFDVTSYALWKTAAEYIPDYTQRDVFVRNIGRSIYKEAKNMGLLRKDALMTKREDSSDDDDGSSDDDSSSDDEKKSTNKKVAISAAANKKATPKKSKNDSSDDSSDDAPYGPLTGTIPAIMEVLNLFNNTNFCSSYRLGAEDKDYAASSSSSSLPPRTGYNVFDSYDDEDLASGNTVNVLISVYNPATLGASLQITGEGSRFGPEFVGTTLAAVWESAGIYASYETYFVDPVYRPNPKDFFPDEQLLQFTLVKK